MSSWTTPSTHTPTQVNLSDEGGNTALHVASELGLSHLCQFLMANGADPAIKNDEGISPLEQAPPTICKVFQEEVIKGLSDVESELLEAAKNGEMDLVKVSVYYYHNVYIHISPHTHPPTYLPTHTQRLCNPHNVNCRDMRGRYSTPLHFAAGFNRAPTVEFLIQQGADVHARDKG